MHTKYMTSGEAAAHLGVSDKTLSAWVREGVFSPSKRASGKGHCHAFNVRDVLAVGIGLNLRKRGLSRAQAGIAVRWLIQRSLSTLADDWRDGRKLLLVIGGAMPFPRLLTPDEVYRNEHLDLAAASATGLPIAIIDVPASYRLLQDKIRQHRAGADRLGAERTDDRSEVRTLPPETATIKTEVTAQ